MTEQLHPAEKPTLVSLVGVEKRGDNILMGFRVADTGRMILLAMPEIEASWFAQELAENT